jgi:hypothetical protein
MPCFVLLCATSRYNPTASNKQQSRLKTWPELDVFALGMGIKHLYHHIIFQPSNEQYFTVKEMFSK